MMSSPQALSPDLVINLVILLQELPFSHNTQSSSAYQSTLLQDPEELSTSGSNEQHEDRAEQQDQNKPIYLTTLPFELREVIYTYLAVAPSFDFLRVCRSMNTQATPLLYKYGTYHIRAIHPRHQYSICVPPSTTLANIRNLYISMPEIRFAGEVPSKHDISSQTLSLLHRFSGDVVRRRLCHLDLQAWHLTDLMGNVLRTFVGFKRIRITVRLRPYDDGNGERIRPYDWDVEEEEREDYVNAMAERLGPWLGLAQWTILGDDNTSEGSGNAFESMLFLDFYPGAVVS